MASRLVSPSSLLVAAENNTTTKIDPPPPKSYSRRKGTSLALAGLVFLWVTVLLNVAVFFIKLRLEETTPTTTEAASIVGRRNAREDILGFASNSPTRIVPLGSTAEKETLQKKPKVISKADADASGGGGRHARIHDESPKNDPRQTRADDSGAHPSTNKHDNIAKPQHRNKSNNNNKNKQRHADFNDKDLAEGDGPHAKRRHQEPQKAISNHQEKPKLVDAAKGQETISPSNVPAGSSIMKDKGRVTGTADAKHKKESEVAKLIQEKGVQSSTTGKKKPSKIETVEMQSDIMTKKKDDTTTIPTITKKCSPWDINIDDWWQDHPTWEPSEQDTNDTHTCFRPIDNPQRVAFLQRVHEIQFPHDLAAGCSLQKPKHKPKPLAVRKIWNHGFAATLIYILNEGFWSAYRENRTFRHFLPEDNFRWQYVPPNTTTNTWAACPSQDHECYFLPITNCPRPPTTAKEENSKKKYIYHEVAKNQTLLEQMIWLSHYLMRPRQELRRNFYRFWNYAKKAGNIPHLTTPCTWIHVRRGDAMSEKGYARNFYSIQEYLQRGKIRKGETILLLTDDASAIEEAELLHGDDYHWVYWNRTRNRGPTGYNSHFPSHNTVLEVLILLAERKLASRCHKGVHGHSNVARMMRNAMLLEQGSLTNMTMVEIDRGLKKTRVEAEDFMKNLEEQLHKARRQKKKKLAKKK